MNEDWLHKIHDRMADYETDEPTELWNAIEARMHDAAPGHHAGKKRVMPVWMKRSAGIAAMIAVAVAIGIVLFDIRPDMTMPASPVATSATRTHAADRIDESQLIAAAEPPAGKTSAAKNSAKAPVTAKHVHEAIEDDIPQATLKEETDSAATLPPTEPAPTHRDSTPAQPRTGTAMPLPPPSDFNPASPTPRRKAGISSLSIYSSGATGGLRGREEGDFTDSNRHPDDLLGTPPPDDKSGTDAPDGTASMRRKSGRPRSKHTMPIRAGITFAYNLSNRLWIESGLCYTNLRSTYTSGSDKDYTETEQTLQYIGIPANLKYSIYSRQRLVVYASAGVLAEKCFSATSSLKHVTGNRQTSLSGTERLEQKPMQWSLNAAMGVQFRLVNSVNIFAEPGISYYFDDGTDIETVYKDKPLNFNLNFGLRFTFGK